MEQIKTKHFSVNKLLLFPVQGNELNTKHLKTITACNIHLFYPLKVLFNPSHPTQATRPTHWECQVDKTKENNFFPQSVPFGSEIDIDKSSFAPTFNILDTIFVV